VRWKEEENWKKFRFSGPGARCRVRRKGGIRTGAVDDLPEEVESRKIQPVPHLNFVSVFPLACVLPSDVDSFRTSRAFLLPAAESVAPDFFSASDALRSFA
jgi:hypothetical protein